MLSSWFGAFYEVLLDIRIVRIVNGNNMVHTIAMVVGWLFLFYYTVYILYGFIVVVVGWVFWVLGRVIGVCIAVYDVPCTMVE